MPEPDGEVIVVLAGNRRQFEDWCREAGRSPKDASTIDGSTERAMLGVYADRLEIVGTFWQKENAPYLLEIAVTRLNRRGYERWMASRGAR